MNETGDPRHGSGIGSKAMDLPRHENHVMNEAVDPDTGTASGAKP